MLEITSYAVLRPTNGASSKVLRTTGMAHIWDRSVDLVDTALNETCRNEWLSLTNPGTNAVSTVWQRAS